MPALGIFDPSMVAVAQQDPADVDTGWFDPDLVDAEAGDPPEDPPGGGSSALLQMQQRRGAARRRSHRRR